MLLKVCDSTHLIMFSRHRCHERCHELSKQTKSCERLQYWNANLWYIQVIYALNSVIWSLVRWMNDCTHRRFFLQFHFHLQGSLIIRFIISLFRHNMCTTVKMFEDPLPLVGGKRGRKWFPTLCSDSSPKRMIASKCITSCDCAWPELFFWMSSPQKLYVSGDFWQF